jgi:hypothetical protein
MHQLTYCSKSPDKVINELEMVASTPSEKQNGNHFSRLRDSPRE